MATSSITHNFVISDKKTAKKFIDIICSPAKPETTSVKYRMVSDSNEISSLFNIRKSSDEQ